MFCLKYKQGISCMRQVSWCSKLKPIDGKLIDPKSLIYYISSGGGSMQGGGSLDPYEILV